MSLDKMLRTSITFQSEFYKAVAIILFFDEFFNLIVERDIFRGFKYEVQHGLEIHETPDAGF